MTKRATDVKVGDVLNVNTGYFPLDDENCKVLKIKHGKGMFGEKMIDFFIESKGAGNHWFSVSPNNTVTIGN